MTDSGKDRGGPTRRDVLGLGILGACGLLGNGCSTRRTTLPDPTWSGAAAGPVTTTEGPYDTRTGVLPRNAWAGGQPVPSLMNPMTPIVAITIHHEGMSAFLNDDADSAARRLEAIRRAHRRDDWGDIGYHYAVDRGGRVWTCRPVSWQGAHVRDHNIGNIGVMALGNFEVQEPTEAQVSAVRRHVVSLMRTHRVPESHVKTHRELAPTACPGRYLQQRIDETRMRGGFERI